MQVHPSQANWIQEEANIVQSEHEQRTYGD
jgi:hypothetical protein